MKNRAIVLFLLCAAALGWILAPFYGVILWAGVIALLFVPWHRRLLAHWPMRPNLVALATMILVVVLFIAPSALLLSTLAREGALVFQGLQSGTINPDRYLQSVFNSLPAWTLSLLRRFAVVDFDTARLRVTTALLKASQFLATQAFSFGQYTFEAIAGMFISLYLGFFFLRDSVRLQTVLRKAIPLSSADKDELINRFVSAIRATVKGSLVVGAIQGALGSLAFWALDIQAALLWGVLMAIASLLPPLGASLIWLPVTIYLLLSGSTASGLALLLYGVLVVSLVDNLLRPVLVGKGTHMPDYVVMLSTIGGVTSFGINGFILGPVIAATFFSAWHVMQAHPDAAQD